MFSYCSSLISLPDISKWKVNKMMFIFSFFSSLKSLPDISNWKANNDIIMNSDIVPADSSSSKYDYKFRLFIFGGSCVGKSNLILRFTENKFIVDTLPTIVMDYRTKNINIENTLIRLYIYDTNSYRIRDMMKQIRNFRDLYGIILLYDISKEKSFEYIHNWIKEIELNAQPNVPKILVANKCDIEDRDITEEEGKQLAFEFGLDFVEASSKTNKNINEIFIYITLQILKVIMDPQKIKTPLKLNNYKKGLYK